MDERPFLPNVALRAAGPSDAALLGTMRAAQQAEIEGDCDPAEVLRYARECADFFERELASQPVWMYAWLAAVDDDVAGVAVLTLAPAMPRLGLAFGPDGRIRDVYVEPRYRRRGIARALTRAAIARATLLGVSRLTLGASKAGRPLYESLGFIDRPEEMVYASESASSDGVAANAVVPDRPAPNGAAP